MSGELFLDGIKYLSAHEAAVFSGLNRDYIARLARKGKLRARRVGKNWYVEESSMQDFLIAQKSTSEQRRAELIQSRRTEYARSSRGSLQQVGRRGRTSSLQKKFGAVIVPPIDPRTYFAAERRSMHRIHPIHSAPMYVVGPGFDFLHRVSTIITVLIVAFGSYAFVYPAGAERAILTARVASIRVAQHFGGSLAEVPAKNSVAAVGAIGSLEDIARAWNQSVDSYFSGLKGFFASDEQAVVSVTIVSAPSAIAHMSAPTKPVSTPTAQKPVVPSTVINQPVIERVVETQRVVSVGGITEQLLNERLSLLRNELMGSISSNTTVINNTYETVGAVARSDNFDDVNITDSDITDSRITGGSISGVDIDAGNITGILAISNGGTGTSTAPTYGKLLVGNSSGGYDYVATSSLGISGGGAGNPGGSDTQVQFNDGGSFNGDSTFTFNKTSDLLTFANGSSTVFSSLDGIFVGRSATTSIYGSATSTFGAGIETTALNVTSTTATSTFANGIRLTGGCFQLPDGSCAGTGGGSGATFGQSWEIFNGSYLAPTTTLGVIVNASSTFSGGLTISNSTTTNATTTNLAITGITSALLTTNAQGTVVATSSLGIAYGGTGATTASGARTNLGAAASGANSDITSLSGLTTALSVPQGGTGWTNLFANSILLGNGTGAVATTSAGTNGQVLALVSGVPTWVATTTLSTISGTLDVSKGGTGATTFSYGLVGSAGGTTALTTFATSSLGLLTTHVTEGSNLYYTDARVQAFIHASTTIPKTYTANTFTALQTFANASSTLFSSTYASTTNLLAGSFTLGTLNGPLHANNGVVSATTSVGVLYGGTGLTTAPSYGQLLLGQADGTYALTATTSLGLPTFAYLFPSNATSTLLAFNGGLTAYASSTIGAGTQATGLTINGGATTTGNILGQGTLTISGNTTLNGTLTATAGLSTLSNLLLTGSTTLQNFTAANSTTTNATTTNLAISSLLTFNGITGNEWSDFCESITGGSTLCDGVDSTGGGSGLATSTDIADTWIIYGTSAGDVGAESAFTYDDATNKLTVENASTTRISASYASSTSLIAGNFTLGTLNGPLHANNGVVSATTSIGVLYGGTGLTTAPSYGQVLVGNASGGYTLTATSSLGISGGGSSFGQSWEIFNGSYLAPTTTLGVIVSASSTIGNGTQAGGLTIAGGATTTGNLMLPTSGSLISFNSGDLTLTHSSNLLTIAGGNLTLGSNSFTAGSILASADDVGALGASGTAWSDLFLASGGIINWNAGDVTVTHAANTLTFGGASSGYVFSDGNVGIGVSSNLDSPLTFAASAGEKINLYRIDVDNMYGFGISSGQLNYHVDNNADHVFYEGGDNGDGTEIVRFDGSSGNVGIGTSTPATLLSLAGSTGLFASTTATSTFQGGGVNLLTAAGNTGCFAINGTCLPTLASVNTLVGAAYPFPSNATSTLLTFNGGLLSVGSTTINGNATTTGMLGVGSLFINNERFTDLTGDGLTISSNALTVDDVTPAMLQSADFGEFTCNGTNCSLDAESQTLAEASDVTITAAVYGDLLMYNGSAWVDTATSSLGIAISDTTGTLGVSRGGTGATTFSYGLIGSTGGTTALTNFATSSLGLLTTDVTEGSSLYYTDARVNAYIHASTTIPKTYTSNTFTGANTFSSTVTLSGLNGPLDARAGVVSATTSIGVLYGGTGLTTAPSYGQLLLGNASGGYTLTATSSLGLPTFSYLFPSNATSTTLTFSGGLLVTASTTIGDGTQTGGLTVSGGATTTGNAYFASNIGVRTQPSSYALDVAGFINTDQYSGFKQAGNTVLYASTTNNTVAVGASGAASWMSATSSQRYSIAIGVGALSAAPINASAANNTAIGYEALRSNTSGGNNVALGANALFSNTSGSENFALGSSALYNNNGDYNVAIGSGVLSANTSGNYNIGIGRLSMQYNQTGENNVALGGAALNVATSSSNNTTIGYFAGSAISGATGQVGGNNTLIGYQAGANITTGSYNTILGSFGGGSSVTTGSNNILIGQDVRNGLTVTGSNQLNIGNLLFGTGLGSGADLATGNIGIGTSSPYSKLTVWGGSSGNIFEAVTNASTTALAVSATGFGTTTVSGLNISGSATTTSSVGINLSGGCFAIGGTCLSTSGSSFSYPFPSDATTTKLSFTNGLSIGTTTSYATTTIWGNTSGKIFEVANNASTTLLSISGSGFGTTTVSGLTVSGSATSTSNVGWNLSGGCFAVNNVCITNADLSTYVTASGGSANRVAFFSGSGTNISSDADLTFDGTTLTARDLIVSHTAPILSINDSGSTGTDFRIDVSAGVATFNADIAGSLSTDAFVFATNNDEKVRITEAGRLGIGTTSPYAKLSVVGPVVAEYFHATSTSATSTIAGGLVLGANHFVYDHSADTIDINVDTDLSGDVTISGGGSLTISASGAVNQTGAGQVTFAGNVDATNGLDVTTANFTVGGSNFTVAPGSGNTSIGGTLGVTGASTLSSTLKVVGAVNASSTLQVDGASRFYSTLRADGAFTAAGSGTGLSVTNNASIGGTLSVTGAGSMASLSLTSGTLALNSQKITGLASPDDGTDAANKTYVDSVAQGLDLKDSVAAATTGNITLSGEQTVDGVSLVAGDRVLVKDQSDETTNGIYTVAGGSWSRSTDADTDAEVDPGMFTFVTGGTVNADSGWVLTTAEPITVGSTELTFTQFSGAGQITAGTGLTKSGNTLNAIGTADRITANADSIDIASTYVGQSSITTVGALASGSIASGFGNINIGSNTLTAGTANFTNISGSAINGTGNLSISGNGTFSGTLSVTGASTLATTTFSGDVAFGGKKITGLADPTSAQEAATKAYVDAVAQGLTVKASVRVATTSNLTLSGAQTIDGVSAIAGDRVLLMGQTDASENGIYVVAAGAWSRSTDADENAEVVSGLFTFVEEGTDNANTGWALITEDPITLDTTDLSFTQFSGSSDFTAGDGLTKSGTTINAVGTTNRISVTADAIDISSNYVGQSSITTVGALTSGSIASGFGSINIGSNSLTAGESFFATTTSYGALSIGRTATTTIRGDGATSTFAGGISLAAGNINLATGGSFLINNALALNASTLGSTVVSSSLTSVGALDSGSITTGFGDINIGANTLGAGTTTITNLIVTNNSTSTFEGAISSSAGDLFLGGETSSDDIILNRYGGNVGIATTSPSARLHVKGAGTAAAVFEGSAADYIVALGSVSGAGHIQSWTNSSFEATANLTINPSGGNVGIGTTTPLDLLSIYNNSTGGGIGLGASSNYNGISLDGGGALNGWNFLSSASDRDLFIRANASNDIRFQNSSGSDLMTVLASGNVGVGTTSPMSPLTVSTNVQGVGRFTSSASTGAGILFDALGTGGRAYSIFSTADGAAAGGGRLAIYDETGSSYRMVISSSGNVGIGTTTPWRKLSITDAVSTAQQVIAYDNTRYTSFLTTSVGDLVIDPQGGDASLLDDNLWVCTGGSCPSGTPSGTGNLIVESRIGIGTTTPREELHIEASDPRIELFDNDAAISSSRPSWYVGQNGTNFEVGTTTNYSTYTNVLSIVPNTSGAIATSTFTGDIKITGKLDVATIDPPYTIDGVKYATFVPSMTGVKEETTMTLALDSYNARTGKYEAVIAFDEVVQGSDLWLFYQIVDFGVEWQYLSVLLTPAFDGQVFYSKDIERNALVISGTEKGEVSMRLTANRYDHEKWPNLRKDQDGNTEGTHVISSKKPKATVESDMTASATVASERLSTFATSTVDFATSTILHILAWFR